MAWRVPAAPMGTNARVRVVGLPTWTRCAVLLVGGLAEVARAIAPLAARGAPVRRVLRVGFSGLLGLRRPGGQAAAPPAPLIGSMRVRTPSAALPDGWDEDSRQWATAVLDGELAPPSPDWDAVESQSDRMRMRGVLPLLAQMIRDARSEVARGRMGELLDGTVAACAAGRPWAWDTTNAALRLVSMLRAAEILAEAGERLPNAERLRGFVLAHEPVLALGHRVEPVGNHEAVNVAGRAAFRLLVSPEAPLPGALRAELAATFAAQFLPDGGHVERSPHYQLQLIALLDQIVQADRRRGGMASAETRALADRTRRALGVMLAPGGTPLRFGDACRSWSGLSASADVRRVGAAPSPKGGLRLARHFGIAHWRWTAGGRELALYVDVGPLGHERNPGHGHADALSYCLYVDGEELLADPGTYAYSAAPDSVWFKLAHAHTQIHWPTCPSHELAGFYRWRRAVRAPTFTILGKGPGTVLEARQQWSVDRRRFAQVRRWTIDGRVLQVEDLLRVSHPLPAAARLALAPGLRTAVRGGVVSVHGKTAVLRAKVLAGPVAHPVIVPGWYAPRYGVRVEAPALEWSLAPARGERRIVTHLEVR